MLKRFLTFALLVLGAAPIYAQDIALVGRILFVADRDGNPEIYVMDYDGTSQTRVTNNAATEQQPAWSPIGTQILFATNRDDNFEIYVANDDGSNEVRLTNDASTDDSPAWSPDGSKIAFQTNRDGNIEIYTMDSDGSNLANLTNNAADDKHPRWSADGSKILFQTMRDGNWEVYAMNVDGSSPTNLTNNAAADERPNGSPDGNEVVFDSDRDGNVEIYRMNSDGTGQTNLSSNAASDFEPSWSADGTRVAFRSDRDGNNEVYTMERDGASQTRLTTDAGSDDQAAWFELKAIDKTVVGFPAFQQLKLRNLGGVALNVSSITSSDGQFTTDPTSGSVAAVGDVALSIVYAPTSAGTHATTLTFTTDDTKDPSVDLITHGIGVDEPELQVVGDVVFTADRDGNNEIYVMDLDGTGQTNITNDAGSDQFASFSPDGGRVVWQTDRDGNFNIYAMDANGSNVSALTTNAASDVEPSFSPDGAQVAWSTTRDGNSEIYVMFGDGTGQTNITNNAGNDIHPRWSPDGSRIVFQTDRDGNQEIYAMDPDGSNVTRLTTDAGTDELPQYSPDGTQIAFSSDRDGDYELFLMNADGTSQSQITTNTNTDTAPTWSPDGTRLMFTSNRLGDFEIFSADTDLGKVFRLTNDSGNDVDPDFSQVRSIGKVEVGSPVTRSVFVQNRGNSALNVSSITSSDTKFTLSTSSLAIPASGQAQVDVTFTPTAAGFVTSTLTLTSDDPKTSTATLTMSATGFVPAPDLLLVTDMAYVSDRDGNEEIYKQDVETPTETNLTSNAATDTDPHVSPDGSSIAFSTNRDGNFEIYKMNADGTSPTRLTTDAGTDAFAAWSPTGEGLVWQTNRDGNDEIYKMDADGSNPTNLTNHANGDLHPRWSPDGQSIVFHSDRDGNNEIYVMNADGTGQTRLTTDAGSDREPDWSPDGSRIAFVSNRDGNDEIYVIDADGANPTRMTSDAGTDESPTWSADGSRIAFRSDRDGDGELWVVTSDGSTVFQMLHNTSNERVPSWGNYRHMGESPAGVAVSRSMRIFNPGQGSLTVSGIVSSDPQFTFSPSSFTVAEGAGQTVNVTYGPTTSTTAYAFFTLTSDDSDAPTMKLMANGIGLASGGTPTVSVTTTSVDFDSTAVDTTKTLPIAVKNLGGGLLNVTGVSVAGNGFSVSPSSGTVLVGDSLVVDVTFAPTAIGLLVGEVSIAHDDAANTTPIVVSVRGSGVDAIPVLSLSELNFGEAQVNSPETIHVSVTNLGNIPLLIHDVEPDSGVFSGSPDSIEVAIGPGAQSLNVTFAPDSAIAFVDTLNLFHNGSGSPLRVPLSGTGTPEPPPPEPILAFGLVNIGTGPIQAGATTQVPLSIVNSGDDTLRVSDVSSDLAFASFSATSFDLPPGADSTVTVDVTPQTIGPFEGTVSVAHNGADSPSSLPVSGEVIAPQVAFTETELDFGPVQSGTTPELAATLVNDSPTELSVSGVGTTGPFASDTTPFTVAPGEQKSLPITFTPGGTGPAEGSLQLFHDNPFLGALELPIRAEVLGMAFEIGPNELFMVNPGGGITARDTLSFSNLTDSTLVVGAATSDGRFSVDPVTAEVGPGASQDFIVTFTSDGSGRTTAEVTLSHNAPGSPPSTIPIIVENGEAEIVLGVDRLQFETVGVGDTLSSAVRVYNPGSDTLFVKDIVGNDASNRFTADPAVFSVAPGDSVDVQVSFIPDGPGSLTDFLVFNANVGLGENMPEIPGVSVVGTGRGPEMAIAPDRLFFATQDITRPDSQAVRITNVGNDSLRLFAIQTQTSQFVTDAEPVVLGEGEGRDVHVIYTPDGTTGRTDTLVVVTNVDTARILLEAAEVPNNVGRASLSLSRLDALLSPQVGDTISLALDLMPAGDTVSAVDAFIGIPSDFFALLNPSSPFSRQGLTQEAFVLVNDVTPDAERARHVASLSTSLFTPRIANGVLARLDLVVVSPLEEPAPVSVLSEFPLFNSQYLVTNPAGQSFTFKATEPEAFGNLPPQFLSLPLLKTEEDGSAEMFMNSRIIDPDGPLSEIAFTFTPGDSLLGIAVQTLFDSLVTVVFFPPPDKHGVFPVEIVARDAGGASDTSAVLIEVEPRNDPPTVQPDTVLVRGGGFLVIPLLERAFDIDGDSLTVTTLTAATNGEVQLNDGRSATYTPEPDFNGEASFSFVVSDGNGGEASGTIVAEVVGTNQRPVIGDLPTLSGVVDSPFAFILTDFKSDPDDSSHTLAWGVDLLSGPAQSARIDGDLLEVFPAAGRIGLVRVLLALFDPFGALDAREVEIAVEPRTRIGDFNGDFAVDFFDLVIFAAAWAAVDGDDRFVPLADLNANGEIDLDDFRMFAQVFATDF